MVNVLVIDDDPAICDCLRDLLEYEGYRVSIAENGGPGLIRMRNSRESLVVVLGLLMPHVDGEDVLRAVAADPALAQRHRIIMVTAVPDRALSGNVAALREQLDVPLLTMPFAPEALLESVAQAAAQL